MLPEAARVPSGLTAQQSTQFLCPFSVTTGVCSGTRSVNRCVFAFSVCPARRNTRHRHTENASTHVFTFSVCSGSTPKPERSNGSAIQSTATRGTQLSDTMHLSISFRKSNPPQNRQLDSLISINRQQVDGFVEELTF